MKPPVVLIALLALCVIAMPADARRDGSDDRGDRRAERGRESGSSAGRAAESARRQSGGRVLSVKPGDSGYRVRVLTPSGEVRHIVVPGRDR